MCGSRYMRSKVMKFFRKKSYDEIKSIKSTNTGSGALRSPEDPRDFVYETMYVSSYSLVRVTAV